jgi:hypothetical protein
MLVVVPDVFLQKPCQVTAAEEEDPVEALCPHCPDPTLRVGVGSGRANGVLMIRMASEAKISSKLAVNLASRSRIRNLNDRPRSTRSPTRVAGHLGDEGTCRMVGDPEDAHLSSPELDHEEHVELLQRNGVHGEEVRGQDAACLDT